MKRSGECIDRAECPECGSSDGVQIFLQDNGSKDAFCFPCGEDFRNVDGLTVSKGGNRVDNTTTPKITMDDVTPLEAASFRGIRKEVMERFGVKVGYDTANRTEIAHVFSPSYDAKGNLSGYEHRDVKAKEFRKVGETKGSLLFGQNVCRGNRKLFVTEGAFDAMALYQVLLDLMPPKVRDNGHTPTVVSLSGGIAGAVKQLTSECVATWMSSSNFKEVILVFDNDTPGMEGAEKVAKALSQKVLIAKLPLKDANDMLLADRGKEMQEACVYNAQPYEPDGIINGRDAWDRYKKKREMKCYSYPEQFVELNAKTYGWRKGGVTTITSGSGMGKTQFTRELEYDIGMVKKMKVACLKLEEDIGDSIEGLIALHLNKRIHLPDIVVPEEFERKAFEDVFAGGMYELYDHFGGMNDDSLFSRIRYFATYLKCEVIILDHLSIVISETADEGDERRRIDAVMTKLSVMAKSLDVAIFLVVHLRKAAQGKSFEEGYVPTSDDLRGSAAIKQLSADIIALARNQQEKDPIKKNTTSLHVLKCRFSGDTGEAGFAYFDPVTGRYVHSEDPNQEEDADEFNDESGAY